MLSILSRVSGKGFPTWDPWLGTEAWDLLYAKQVFDQRATPLLLFQGLGPIPRARAHLSVAIDEQLSSHEYSSHYMHYCVFATASLLGYRHNCMKCNEGKYHNIHISFCSRSRPRSATWSLWGQPAPPSYPSKWSPAVGISIQPFLQSLNLFSF